MDTSLQKINPPVGWGCRIHRDPPPRNECPRYDTKQFDGEIPVMLGNEEYPFTAITTRSTLARSGST